MPVENNNIQDVVMSDADVLSNCGGEGGSRHPSFSASCPPTLVASSPTSSLASSSSSSSSSKPPTYKDIMKQKMLESERVRKAFQYPKRQQQAYEEKLVNCEQQHAAKMREIEELQKDQELDRDYKSAMDALNKKKKELKDSHVCKKSPKKYYLGVDYSNELMSSRVKPRAVRKTLVKCDRDKDTKRFEYSADEIASLLNGRDPMLWSGFWDGDLMSQKAHLCTNVVSRLKGLTYAGRAIGDAVIRGSDVEEYHLLVKAKNKRDTLFCVDVLRGERGMGVCVNSLLEQTDMERKYIMRGREDVGSCGTTSFDDESDFGCESEVASEREYRNEDGGSMYVSGKEDTVGGEEGNYQSG